MEHRLAFKGVNLQNQSLWVGGSSCGYPARVRAKLTKTYKAGQTVRASHRKLPLWLSTCYPTYTRTLWTGCEHIPQKVLLVRVPVSALTAEARFLTNYGQGFERSTLGDIADRAGHEKAFGTTRLTVLEEVDMTKYKSVDDAMNALEVKYGLKRVLSKDVPNYDLSRS